MICTVYRPLSAGYPTFAAAKITDIFKITSYDYTQKFYEVGSFTLVIPANEPSAELIGKEQLLFTSDGDYLYITDTKETEESLTITGYDLKYILASRISLFPTAEQEAGTYGYYVVAGTTEYCIKDIIQYNITAAADTNRRIYGFVIADNAGRGLTSDSYMTRLEPLDEVIGTLCKNAEIGYTVTPNFTNSTIVFDVSIPTNRTDSQTDVNKIVFAKQFNNIQTVSRELGVSAEKNALYAVQGKDTGSALVQLVNRDDTTADYGLYRRETSVSVSCDVGEIRAYALKEAEDKIETDSFEVEAFAVDTYKKEWFVGDIVTFKYKNLFLDTNIIAVQYSATGNSTTLKLTAGQSAPKVISTVSATANKANTNVQATKFKQSSGGVGIAGAGTNSEIHNDLTNNTATAPYSFAFGNECNATGYGALAGCYVCNASGIGAVALGFQTTASAKGAFAAGKYTKATAEGAFAAGAKDEINNVTTEASGEASFAFGYGCKAKTLGSVAMGISCVAETNVGAVALGSGCHTTGADSLSCGLNATANGDYSFSQGYQTSAYGYNSVALGAMTTANDLQAVCGVYNVLKVGSTAPSSNQGMFIVGNGTSDATRSNAFRVDGSGNAYAGASINGTGADFAEMHEWQDGENEDRTGLFVTYADGEKIRLANADDTYILGVVSATPTVVGDTASEVYHGMYLRDVFGRVQMHEVTIQATETEAEHTELQPIINPEYNSETAYKSRLERKEWAAIGIIGKLIVIDDGSCKVNGYCKATDDGKATAAETGYRVIARIDENHVKILLK